MTFPDGDQPNLAFTTVSRESLISPTTGRRIWGVIGFPANVSVPVTTVCFDDGSVIVELEVGAPPPDTGLPIKLDIVGTEEFCDAIFKAAGGRGERFEASSPAVTYPLADLSSSHRKEV